MHARLIKPFHFKVFFSAKYVYATVLDKVTNVIVTTVSSNSRAFDHYLGPGGNRNNEKACELLGKILAYKIKEKEVRYCSTPPPSPTDTGFGHAARVQGEDMRQNLPHGSG
jgi:ribosomal protein L18